MWSAPEAAASSQASLDDLARWTGGATFTAGTPAETSLVAQRILTELRHQYSDCVRGQPPRRMALADGRGAEEERVCPGPRRLRGGQQCRKFVAKGAVMGHTQVAVLALLAAAMFALPACATKGYVNQQITGVNGKVESLTQDGRGDAGAHQGQRRQNQRGRPEGRRRPGLGRRGAQGRGRRRRESGRCRRQGRAPSTRRRASSSTP